MNVKDVNELYVKIFFLGNLEILVPKYWLIIWFSPIIWNDSCRII